jgi:ribonuclease VapC
VDASACVAILANEPDRGALLAKLSQFSTRSTSAIATYETTLAVSRLLKLDVGDAQKTVARFSRDANLVTVNIDAETAGTALLAFQKFGKGRHRAALNMGDCFSYACAKILKVPLLCKGDDFIHTDIRIA